VFGADKTTGMTDPVQHDADAGDLHEWQMSLRSAAPRAGGDAAATSCKPFLHQVSNIE
jgi:hypothetical protein